MKVNEWMTVSGITMYVFIRKVDGKKRQLFVYRWAEKLLKRKGVVDKVVDNWPYYIGCNYRFTNGEFAPENFLKWFIWMILFCITEYCQKKKIQDLYNN